MVCFTTDKQMGYPCEITVVDSRTFSSEEPIIKIPIPTGGPKVTSMIWSGLDDYLLTGRTMFSTSKAYYASRESFWVRSGLLKPFWLRLRPLALSLKSLSLQSSTKGLKVELCLTLLTADMDPCTVYNI